jgi:halimadienyl-diphosphate synthase
MHTYVPGNSSVSRAIASTPYDTAWVAAVPHPYDRRDPRFPSALAWIAANQHADGSWGSLIPYKHDRIICTLAALIPLARFGRREVDRVQIRRGERYLWQHGHLLRETPCELVGFELLLPTLIELATDAGVHVPPFLDVFIAERNAKLALLPPEMLYSPGVTIAHSLEFLGTTVNPLQLINVQAPNGSIGNSPAATAFMLQHIDDPAAVAYLQHCLAGDAGSAVPVLEPCETYEALWSAYHAFLGGTPAAELVADPAFRAHLLQSLAAGGVSLSPSFPVADADDTAVALMLLHEAGIEVEPTALQHFERDDYFVSFPYERHASTGVNIHVLQALTRFPSYPNRDRAIDKILHFLESAREHQTFWIDKWHISPYYATSHALAALCELPATYRRQTQPMLDSAVEWIMQTQNADGSWGFYGVPTAEETAYAVLGLQAIAPKQPAVSAAIAAGQAYLTAHTTDDHPAMWVDKCLYYPFRIVATAIMAGCATELV